jgi:hypothetical protein
MMKSKLTHLVETVKTKAPKARIIMVDYPAVLPENGKPCSVLPITQDRKSKLPGNTDMSQNERVPELLRTIDRHASASRGPRPSAKSSNRNAAVGGERQIH